MQLSNYFVSKSSLSSVGLTRFMYYENTLGRLVSPAVPHIYIVFVQNGYGYFNNQKLQAGDVFAYGFNMHPLVADICNLTFLGVEMSFSLFYQLTKLPPSYCQDVLLLEPNNPLTYFLNHRLVYYPVKDWIPLLESFVRKQLHLTDFWDTRTQRLAAVTQAMLQPGFSNFDQLTWQFGISYRALQRDFNSLLGITPKLYQSVHRVYQAAYYIKSEKLNDAALLAGYTDQAHMNRDFKRFAGITPLQVKITHDQQSKLYRTQHPRLAESSSFIIPY